jgi:hypothetical protein
MSRGDARVARVTDRIARACIETAFCALHMGWSRRRFPRSRATWQTDRQSCYLDVAMTLNRQRDVRKHASNGLAYVRVRSKNVTHRIASLQVRVGCEKYAQAIALS